MAAAAHPASRPAVPGRSRARASSRARSTRRSTDLPIVSPHGHTDPQWFADDAPFADAIALFITPDHYVFRMLYSQGVPLEDLGIPRRDGGAGRDATHARSGARSPRTITCSAARRRASGSTTRSRRCSAATSG